MLTAIECNIHSTINLPIHTDQSAAATQSVSAKKTSNIAIRILAIAAIVIGIGAVLFGAIVTTFVTTFIISTIRWQRHFSGF